MRGVTLVLVGLIMSAYTSAQDKHNELIFNHYDRSFVDFLSSLKPKKGSDYKLVKRLFDRAHITFLKNYRAYSQIPDVFEQGNYDCLSGTYFLASALDDLGVPYKVHETNYHIFLTVQTKRGQILLESTDRDHGLITDQNLIQEKISIYQSEKTTSGGAELYLSKLRMFHELLPAQLPGLLYFNRAVQAFNKNELADCCRFLEQAWKIYDNPRIEAFTPILLHSIEVSQLDSSSKERLTSLLRTYQQSSVNSLASR